MADPVRPLRCAVYTRKSSEEGLEQDFHSLQAQREAGVDYIRCQRHQGWRLIDTAFDDGGYSGGTLDRPALQRLLEVVRAHAVDVIVVYKVDRLSRSLGDFARLVELFDAHRVSFVSVTQQFSTTTSMGRLTLNVLLSFAQFEREVTAERIRDKIAASKRKGLWMGGFVPLGYRAAGRTLAIDPEEAALVRRIFDRYLALGCVRQLKEELDRDGCRTPLRRLATGRVSGGLPFRRGHLYKLLRNPLYRGEIAHKGQRHPGQHPAIVDAELWEAVHARLAANTVRKATRAKARNPSPLAGKLVDAEGKPLTPSHAVKAGRRYRYYIAQRDGVTDPKGWRIAAGEIEGLVCRRLVAWLADTAQLAERLDLGSCDAPTVASALAAAHRLAAGLDDAATAAPLLAALVSRVVLQQTEVTTTIDLHRLRERLGLPPTGEASLCLAAPIAFKHRGVETRIVLTDRPAGATRPRLDPALLRVIARGHVWFDELVTSRLTIPAIAAREGLHPNSVSREIDLAFLAPDVVEAVLEGRQPVDLTAARLLQHRALARDWARQRRELGIGRT